MSALFCSAQIAHKVPSPAITSCRFFNTLPREVRDFIYAELLDEDSTTFVNTHSINGDDQNLKLVNKQFRSKLNEEFATRVCSLEVDAISIYIIDFDFDKLIDNFLSKLTDEAYAEEIEDDFIQFHFYFTQDFDQHLVDLEEQETSFGRWLKVRDQMAEDGRHVKMEYSVHRVEMMTPEPIRWMLDFYDEYVCIGESGELDRVIEDMGYHFEKQVTYGDVTMARSKKESKAETTAARWCWGDGVRDIR